MASSMTDACSKSFIWKSKPILNLGETSANTTNYFSDKSLLMALMGSFPKWNKYTFLFNTPINYSNISAFTKWVNLSWFVSLQTIKKACWSLYRRPFLFMVSTLTTLPFLLSASITLLRISSSLMAIFGNYTSLWEFTLFIERVRYKVVFDLGNLLSLLGLSRCKFV